VKLLGALVVGMIAVNIIGQFIILSFPFDLVVIGVCAYFVYQRFFKNSEIAGRMIGALVVGGIVAFLFLVFFRFPSPTDLVVYAVCIFIAYIFFGKGKDMPVTSPATFTTCPSCGGSGIVSSGDLGRMNCPRCGGSGSVAG
jgi:hypothetical protein